MNVTKICNKCNETKFLDGFGKRPDSRDGYRAMCKECMGQLLAKYYARNSKAIIKRRLMLKKKRFDAEQWKLNMVHHEM